MSGRTIREPVICLNEKPVTVHADVRLASPVKPGRKARQDNEYERGGTANIFCAVEPKAGRHFTLATPHRSGAEFAKVASELALQYPATRSIHLIMDNLNVHRRKSLTDLPASRSELKPGTASRCTTLLRTALAHPVGGRNGMLRRQCPGRRRIPDLATLQRETRGWNRRMNRTRARINRTFDRKARRKFGHKRNSSKQSQI